MDIIDKLKEQRKQLKIDTAEEFSRLLDLQHRFDFVDEQAWDKAEQDEDYSAMEALIEENDCLSISVTGSMKDYYAKLLCVDSKGGCYIAQEDDLFSQNWIQFSQVNGSYYEIAVVEEMTKKLK